MSYGVKTTTEKIASFDGTLLACHAWEPESAPENSPVALIHHGAAYHGGAYARLGRVLARHGIPAMALDARGHGLSEGERGDMQRRNTLLDDLGAVSSAWRERYRGRPLVLIGESMGGLIVLHHAARARHTPGRADALVLSAPGLTIHPQQVFNRDSLAAVPRSILRRGSASFARPAERRPDSTPRYLTASPGYEAEQLALRGFSANYMLIIAGMSVHSPRAAIRVSVPTLIVHGKKDDVVPYQGSMLLYRMLATRDKTLSLYPDDGHTLFWSQEEAPVYEDLVRWIGSRFPLRN